MALILYSHPLASYCWKVLIALYESGTPFEARTVNLGDPGSKAAFEALWPMAKIPLLDDGGRIVPETSIIIEYLDQRHPGPVKLLPSNPAELLDVRLWDRIFDCYVMDPMQRFIAQQLRPEPERDARAIGEARAGLAAGYDLIDKKLGDGMWAAGAQFSMADCAAAPALFYAATIVPLPEGRTRLASYFERLMARDSVQRVIGEAAPFFKYYPLHHAIPTRFLKGETNAA